MCAYSCRMARTTERQRYCFLHLFFSFVSDFRIEVLPRRLQRDRERMRTGVPTLRSRRALRCQSAAKNDGVGASCSCCSCGAVACACRCECRCHGHSRRGFLALHAAAAAVPLLTMASGAAAGGLPSPTDVDGMEARKMAREEILKAARAKAAAQAAAQAPVAEAPKSE